jgi:hypothetical protein
MEPSYEAVLQTLEESQRDYEFSIIKISEPISPAIDKSSATRTSDVSADNSEIPTPASLEADLAHYKVLFYDIIIYVYKSFMLIGTILQAPVLVC